MTKLQEAIIDLAKDMQSIVDDIEAGPSITQGNYGAYMGVLANFKDQGQRNLIALALIEAGADKLGVLNAMKFV